MESFEKVINQIVAKVGLSAKEKQLFVELGQVKEVTKKSFILKTGAACQYEYLVLNGILRSFYIDENMREHTTMFAMAGWWTGNLKSFLSGEPSEFNIQAVADTTVLRFNHSNKEQLFQQVPKFERYFRILLQNRVIATESRVSQHLSNQAMHSYESFCKKYPFLEQQVPQKYIASYLGITPAYLSRLRRQRTKK